MILTKLFRPETWALYGAVISALMLAAAHGFEQFGGLAACELCYRQREVYWAALVLGLLLFFLRHKPQFRRGGLAVMGLVFLTGMLIAGFHAGVEWKFWPGPASCTGNLQDLSALGTDLLSALEAPSKVPQCDEIPWSMFGISMAGYNTLTSLFLAAISFKLALPDKRNQVEL